jgi:23S rRNA pseudouridine2457 synthase
VPVLGAGRTAPSLADYLKIPNIYPAGRLDADSEGLMLLTDDGKLQHSIAHPDHKEAKTYLVQVDGVPDAASLQRCRRRSTSATSSPSPARRCDRRAGMAVAARPADPPARQDKPTSWIAITLEEGKNRQVRRMTAAVGLPTLRLVRSAIGNISLASHPLMPGEWMEVSPKDLTT